MNERELRRIDPQDYPQELRQTIYDVKKCLELRKQVSKELEHAKTYRKKALKNTLLEADEVIRIGLEGIENKKISETDETKINIGVRIISAVVSGEIRRVEIKKEEGY